MTSLMFNELLMKQNECNHFLIFSGAKHITIMDQVGLKNVRIKSFQRLLELVMHKTNGATIPRVIMMITNIDFVKPMKMV